jgi:hypothetical protein
MEQVKAEVDMQVTTARAFPRNYHQVMHDALSLATMNREIAQACFFSLPRGGKRIEGPSIRLAEIMVSAWGNLRCYARIIKEGRDTITAQGVAWDIERNVLVSQEIDRRIVGRDGARFNSDMITTTKNAASSIALRNAVFRVVPRPLVDAILAQAKATAVGSQKTIDQRRLQAMEAFSKLGIDEARVLKHLDREALIDVDSKDLEHLLGLHTAIRDQEVDIDEIFPEEKGQKDQPSDASGDKKTRMEEAMESLGVPENEVLDLASIEAFAQDAGVPAESVIAWTAELEVKSASGADRDAKLKTLDKWVRDEANKINR